MKKIIIGIVAVLFIISTILCFSGCDVKVTQPAAYIYEPLNELHITEGNITITVNGDILTQADYEYTETDNIKIGDINDKLEDLFTYVVDDTY